jgi:hypothetical protein
MHTQSSFFGLIFSSLLAMVILETSVIAQESQPAQETERASTTQIPELQFFDTLTTGFTFGFEQRMPPVVRERSDGTTYSITVQRRAIDGKALWNDGAMAFLRMTQTIEPVNDPSDIDELLNTTIREAVQSIDKAFGKRRDRAFSDCTLEILGEVRFGKRIDVELLPNGAFAYVECYSFTDNNGNGIGLTLKLREPAPDTLPRDAIWTDEILSGLEIHDLQSDSYYMNQVGGFPLRLPVSAKLQGTRRVNQFVIETGYLLEFGTVRIQMIQLPARQSPYVAAQDQLNGFKSAVTNQASQGLIEIHSTTDIEILGGLYQNGVVRGRSNRIFANNQELYSTLFTAVDQQTVLVANFTGLYENQYFLDEYAKEFFARPMSSFTRKNSTLFVDGNMISLPREITLIRNPDDVSGDEFIIDGVTPFDWETKTSLIRDGHDGHTRVRRLSSEADFKEAHAKLCVSIAGVEDSGREHVSPAAHEHDSKRNVYTTELNVPILQDSSLSTDEHTNSLLIKVSSNLVKTNDHHYMISSVSTKPAFKPQDSLTRAITRWISEADSGEFFKTSIGTIGPLQHCLVQRSKIGASQELLKIDLPAGTVLLRTTSLDEARQSLETVELSNAILRPMWIQAVGEELSGIFPDDSNDLMEHAIGPHEGRMIEAITGDDQLIRMIGFKANDAFVAVVLRASSNDSLNDLESLFLEKPSDDHQDES